MLVGGYTPAWSKTTHVLVLIPGVVHCYLYIYYIYLFFFVWILFAIYQAQKIYRKKTSAQKSSSSERLVIQPRLGQQFVLHIKIKKTPKMEDFEPKVMEFWV